jgi:hypothetical protein
MKRSRRIFAPEDPNHGTDSDLIWSRLGQPTGARRLTAWALLRTVAIVSLVMLLVLVIWHIATRG